MYIDGSKSCGYMYLDSISDYPENWQLSFNEISSELLYCSIETSTAPDGIIWGQLEFRQHWRFTATRMEIH